MQNEKKSEKKAWLSSAVVYARLIYEDDKRPQLQSPVQARCSAKILSGCTMEPPKSFLLLRNEAGEKIVLSDTSPYYVTTTSIYPASAGDDLKV